MIKYPSLGSLPQCIEEASLKDVHVEVKGPYGGSLTRLPADHKHPGAEDSVFEEVDEGELYVNAGLTRAEVVNY